MAQIDLSLGEIAHHVAATRGGSGGVLVAEEMLVREQAVIPLQVDDGPLAPVYVAQADVRRVKAVLERRGER